MSVAASDKPRVKIVALTDLGDLQGMSQEDAGKWLASNVEIVLNSIGAMHSLEMDMAVLHSILTDPLSKKTVEERNAHAVEYLEEIANAS